MFAISSTPFDIDELKKSLEGSESGACVTFEGWVRNNNEGQTVTLLEYEAFEEMAVKEGERIVQEAMAKYHLSSARCVHRVGALNIGDIAVWVGVSAGHRDEAFAACRFIIDEIKLRAPIWKKEHYTTQSSEWINCSQTGGDTPTIDSLDEPEEDIEIDTWQLSPEFLSKCILIDVRERFETATAPIRIAPVVELPLSSFQLDALPPSDGRKYLICCAHGIRSLGLTVRLRELGYKNAYSLRGGSVALDRQAPR